MTTARADTTVLFVMGHGASGTTLLGNTLGQLDGFFHPGELRTLWDEALQGGKVCACGLPVAECELWTRVTTTGFADDFDPDRFSAWHHEAVRVRYTRRLLRLEPGERTGWEALDAYIGVAARLYRAVSEVTGARVIVDTSKRAGDAALLRLLPGVDPYYIQVVRDPRAVVYSWNRRARRNRTLGTARDWLAFSALDEAVRRRVGARRSILLRYEDFVAKPRDTLERAIRLIGMWPLELPLVDERTVGIEKGHTMSGHWIRFVEGPIELREDADWQARMPPRQRWLTTAMTLPYLLRYRYPLRTS
jgi:hypothetical protein